ncbi:MAG: TasA family protein [Bacillota bacterium]
MKTRLALNVILTVLIIAFISFGATFALFSDTTVNSANSFSAGTLVIDSVTPQGTVFSTDMQYANLAPGDTGEGTLTVVNNGTLDALVNISGFIYDTETNPASLFAGTSPLALSETNGTVPIPAGGTADFVINYNFPVNADNTYQGRTGTATINVYAVQARNNSGVVNTQGWTLLSDSGATVEFTGGPTGGTSAYFVTGSQPYAWAEIRNPLFAGIELSSLSNLSYQTYVISSALAQVAPWMILDIDTNDDGEWDDLLYFEPQDQLQDVMPGQWQTWDALTGKWWSSDGVAGMTSGNPRQLAEYLNVYPNAKIVNYTAGGGVRVAAGFQSTPWEFVGFADNITVGSAFFDFE